MGLSISHLTSSFLDDKESTPPSSPAIIASNGIKSWSTNKAIEIQQKSASRPSAAVSPATKIAVREVEFPLVGDDHDHENEHNDGKLTLRLHEGTILRRRRVPIPANSAFGKFGLPTTPVRPQNLYSPK